ncbi:MAG: hypothetical protein RR162_00110 [Oscillospiraceae bacterium]
MSLTIKELNKDLIHRANSNSMSGTRGNGSNHEYNLYAERILGWPISDEKKQKLLDKLYEKRSEILKYEAQHVSVMVAGPAKYNAKRLDKGDKIIELAHDFCEWFNGLESQIAISSQPDEKTKGLVEMIVFCDEHPNFDPTTDLMKLAFLDNHQFIEFYERLYEKYKWRKNSNIFKLYQKSILGEIKEIKKEEIYSDGNFTAYTEGDRAYIKFMFKPQRQLIVALKSRGWFWNNHKDAWSTYLNKVDTEWIKSISERYSNYI